MRDQEKDEVRNLRLFRRLSQTGFNAMIAASYTQEFPPHLQLIRQGGNADFLHVVIDGTVELHAEWSSQRTTMGIIGPVTSFILAACIQDAPYLMSAITLEPSRIVLIPAEAIRVAFRTDADFAVDVTEELASDYRSMVRYIKNLKLRSSRQRLAAYLAGLRKDGRSSIVLPHEKRLLASYLGMTPETLSRAFRDLAEAGIHVDGSRVTITDPRSLHSLALTDPLMD